MIWTIGGDVLGGLSRFPGDNQMCPKTMYLKTKNRRGLTLLLSRRSAPPTVVNEKLLPILLSRGFHKTPTGNVELTKAR